MKQIIINAHEGILYCGQVIPLGADKSYVFGVITDKYATVDNRLFSIVSIGMRLEFDTSDRLQYIEVTNNDNIECSIDGINPFSLTADELVNVLTREKDKEYDLDKVHGIDIPERRISLWRDSSPFKMKQSLAEAKMEGYYEEDMENELASSYFFDTISIYSDSYYIPKPKLTYDTQITI